MSNQYFHFKNFSIHQDKSAMKVCTDACLFGAWVAHRMGNTQEAPKRILDIGTGTGLLALMVAQKTEAIIDAVEIEANAFEQANYNCQDSPWKNRIHVIHDDITTLVLTQQYDWIIVNPPFFENSLRSNDEKKNAALHCSELSMGQLINTIDKHLSQEGRFAVLLPYDRMDNFKKLITDNNFHVEEDLNIRTSIGQPFFRTMTIFGRATVEKKEGEFAIKDAHGNYSERFVELLKDYYLRM